MAVDIIILSELKKMKASHSVVSDSSQPHEQ